MPVILHMINLFKYICAVHGWQVNQFDEKFIMLSSVSDERVCELNHSPNQLIGMKINIGIGDAIAIDRHESRNV